MRIHHVRHVLLAQQATFCFLLLLGEAAGSSSSVAPSVLVHVPAAPRDDDAELEGEADGACDGTRHISGRVGRLEDKRTADVANAVGQKGQRRYDRLLGAASNIRGDW